MLSEPIARGQNLLAQVEDYTSPPRTSFAEVSDRNAEFDLVLQTQGNSLGAVGTTAGRVTTVESSCCEVSVRSALTLCLQHFIRKAQCKRVCSLMTVIFLKK